MSVQLLGTKFNHNTKSANNDALNIRKNATTTIIIPEWRPGMTKPEDSLAVYAIKETKGNIIQIQAKFECSNPSITKVEIRAIQPPAPPFPKGWIGKLIELLKKWPWLKKILNYLISIGYGLNVLGNVKAKEITFGSNGKSDFETFDLQNVWIWIRGVGVYTVKWQWEYRIPPSGQWQKITDTAHRIFVVLETPKKPWSQIYGSNFGQNNIHLPWTDVLEYACQWATWMKTLDGAARRVTEKVFSLGTSIVEYDCPGGGYSHYSAFNFKCTEFLELLSGGIGLGRYINCSDCATIVSTFSNILGCDLWQSRMGNSFDLNEVISIGYTSFSQPCGWWPSFSYHEVAWKGACDVNDEVFDACLKVDGDSDPTSPA